MLASPVRRPLVALLLPLLLGACTSLPAGLAVPAPPPHDPIVDIEHYDLDVDVDHLAGHVEGVVAVQFRALPDRPADTLLLDAVDMQVRSITDHEGRDLAWRQQDNQLAIRLAEPVRPGGQAEVTIAYSCFPRRGLYFVGPSDTDPQCPWQFWSQGESHETRYWVPCWDQPNDRATLTLHATVDGSFLTMGSGVLTSSVVDEKTGRRTDTWQMDTPHVSYLITLLAGQLAQGEIPGGTVPLPVIAQADALPDALVNFAATPDILATFAEFTGRPYPYPKYAQSCIKDFVAGGQENISATTLLHEAIHDPADDPQADQVALISHEAAHMWFGDLITCRDWDDLWLNEGFATWCEIFYEGHLRGEDRLRAAWRDAQAKYLSEAKEGGHPIVWRDFGDPDDTFDSHAYEGAAARLNLLEEVLGPETFRRAVQLYVHRRENSVVDTADFRHDTEEAAGRDLSQFFDEWFYGPGFPQFEVRPVLRSDVGAPDQFAAAADPALANALLVKQVQHGPGWPAVFHLPVVVTWSRGGLEHSQRFEVEARSQVLPLDGLGDLNWVRFDGTSIVPGTVTAAQSEAMWASQLRGASDGVTRLVAAEWFGPDATARRGAANPGWRPDDSSIGQLVEAARIDPFVDVRVAALKALAPLQDERLPPLFAALVADGDARVRQAAAAGLATQPADGAVALLRVAAADDNASVAAAAIGALVKCRDPAAFRIATDLARRTPKYKLDIAIINAVAAIEDEPGVLPFLIAAAAREPVPRVRSAAVAAVARQPDPDGVVFRALAERLDDDNYIVRAAAAAALTTADPERARPLLLARREIEVDNSVGQALDAALRDGSD